MEKYRHNERSPQKEGSLVPYIAKSIRLSSPEQLQIYNNNLNLRIKTKN